MRATFTSLMLGAMLTLAPLVSAHAEPLADRVARLEAELAELKALLKQHVPAHAPVTPAKQDDPEHVKLGGYLEFRYERHGGDGKNDISGADLDSFGMRYGRLKFQGQERHGKYVLQLDTAKRDVIIDDLYGEFDVPRLSLRARFGQQKVPFGYWVVESSSRRLMPERPQVVKELFDGERDTGLLVRAPVNATLGGRRVPLDVSVGLFSGNGRKGTGDKSLSGGFANATGPWTADFAGGAINVFQQADDGHVDNNDRRDIALRVAAKVSPAVEVGVSAYRGTNTAVATGTDATGAALTKYYELDKDRLGAFFRYENPNGAGIKGELVRGDDGPVHTRGGAAELSYRSTPQTTLALRYDEMQRTNEAEGRYLTAALLHHLDEHTRVRLAYGLGSGKATDQDLLSLDLQKKF